jgi:hypothetical protein
MRLRQTFFSLEQKTGEHNFGTPGRLLRIGSILTILVVGLVIIFVAWIFAVLGFFNMKVPAQQYSAPPGYSPPPPPTATQPTQATRYCPTAENRCHQPNSSFFFSEPESVVAGSLPHTFKNLANAL